METRGQKDEEGKQEHVRAINWHMPSASKMTKILVDRNRGKHTRTCDQTWSVAVISLRP